MLNSDPACADRCTRRFGLHLLRGQGRLVERKREEMTVFLRAEGCAEYPVDYAIAIYLYTLQDPPIFQMLNHPQKNMSLKKIISKEVEI